MAPKNQVELRAAAIAFRQALSNSTLHGEKTDQIQGFLKELVDRLAPKPSAPASQDKRLQSQPRKQEYTPSKPKTTGNGTPTAGLFQKRSATIHLGPAHIPVTSITEAERKCFTYQQAHPKVTTEDIAQAIQAAYPTNNYSEQRVISAFKRLQRELTAVQEDAASE